MARPASIVAIVDDDPGVRGSLDSLIRSAGMGTLVFGNAEELLASNAQDRFGCIVTDLHMPGMSGLDLQAEIGRRGWRQPLIVMTAFPTDAARTHALDAGAAAFLAKPIDPDSLLDAIEAVMP
jgi:FixJ family two-component response regulator